MIKNKNSILKQFISSFFENSKTSCCFLSSLKLLLFREENKALYNLKFSEINFFVLKD